MEYSLIAADSSKKSFDYVGDKRASIPVYQKKQEINQDNLNEILFVITCERDQIVKGQRSDLLNKKLSIGQKVMLSFMIHILELPLKKRIV
jgi:hypothetical protein